MYHPRCDLGTWCVGFLRILAVLALLLSAVSVRVPASATAAPAHQPAFLFSGQERPSAHRAVSPGRKAETATNAGEPDDSLASRLNSAMPHLAMPHERTLPGGTYQVTGLVGRPYASIRYDADGLLVKHLNPSGDAPWQTNYRMRKTSLDVASAIRFAHGRQDVEYNAYFITSYTPQGHQLIIAASIAHQASDCLERPFGTNVIEDVFQPFHPDISMGIAQLRPSELGVYAPNLISYDLQNPRIGALVMADKIAFIDRYIQQSAAEQGRSVSPTDRLLLMAIAQNGGSVNDVRAPIDYFFGQAHGNFELMFLHNEEWQELSRWVVLQIEWLLTQGWELPAGVDWETMKETAFAEY